MDRIQVSRFTVIPCIISLASLAAICGAVTEVANQSYPDWKKADWQRTNPDFTKIREEVDKLREDKKAELLAYYEKKKRALDASNKDHALLVATTYSLIFCPDVEKWKVEMQLLDRKFDEWKVPVDAEVARVRFIHKEWVMAGGAGLLDVSKKLLNRFKDDTTRYLAARVLVRSFTIDNAYKGLEIAEELLQKKPEDVKYHFLKGGACFNIFLLTNDRSYGIKSQSSYAKFLELVDESSSWIERGKYWHKRVTDLLDK